MTDKKPMNATQLRQALADAAGITTQQAKLVMDTLTSLTVSEVNEVGAFTVPGICKVTKVHKPAKPEKKMISPLTKQEITVKAKEACNVVKVKPIKALKDAVQ
jgi:nucleoid DNA-binding protein